MGAKYFDDPRWYTSVVGEVVGAMFMYHSENVSEVPMIMTAQGYLSLAPRMMPAFALVGWVGSRLSSFGVRAVSGHEALQ